MKLKANDTITVESDDGILYEMLVKSSNTKNSTVTGEVPFFPKVGGDSVVEEITVPLRSISWAGRGRLR